MRRSDAVLIFAAAAYLLIVAIGVGGSGLHASADDVSEGDVWLLLTSALNVVPELDVPQWLLLASTTAIVIWRHGPKLWWSVALGGHIGAALISYAVIGAAVWLGSASADETAAQADYGISIVLAATLGAMAASGFAAPPGGRGRSDLFCIVAGLIGLGGMIAFSVGWYDMQHVIGWGIGFLLSGWLIESGRFEWTRPQSGRAGG